MKKYKNILTLAVFLGVSVGAQASNLVQNPGFETGTFTNWTLFGNTGAFTTVGTSFPHSGTFAADLGPVTSLGGITQFLTTVPGTTYVLDFWLQNGNPVAGTPNEFIVEWDGAAIYDVLNQPAFLYTHYSFTQLATGTTTQLSFRFRQDPSFFHLDDVNVDVVPEPATMAMFGSGLLALGLWRRRKA